MLARENHSLHLNISYHSIVVFLLSVFAYMHQESIIKKYNDATMMIY